jgi:hypothetical protein
MSPYDRITNGSKCSICSGKRVLSGDNDLASNFPEIAAEWDYTENFPVTPEEVTAHSNKRFTWICSWNSAHTWVASPNTRVKGHGCQLCSFVKVGVNDLKTKALADPLRAHLVIEWAKDLNEKSIDEVAYTANDEFWWNCGKGIHEPYLAKNSNRFLNLTGCPSCSPAAYSTTKPGRFYFLHNQELGAMKFGITNVSAKTDRIRKFASKGWTIVLTIDRDSGLLIKRLEKRMLFIVREIWQLPIQVSPIDMFGMGGATETFSDSHLDTMAISSLIRLEISELESAGVAN